MSPLFKKKPKCPYCHRALDTTPKRKKKCPHCGEYIYVRKGDLVTEEEASIRDWMWTLQYHGITRKKLDSERENRSKKLGVRVSVNDTVWSLLNAAVLKTTDHGQLQSLYLSMAKLVSSEGKNPKPYLTQYARHSLLEFKQYAMVKKVKVLTANDDLVCAGCKAISGKVFTVDEALKAMPIPSVCENESGCRCSYQAVID